MPFDDVRAALVALLSRPTAVASLVFLAGFHAAIWRSVFERAGFPTALASLMLVPPLTILLPLYVALARWPSQRRLRLPARRRRANTTSARPVRRVVQQKPALTGGLPAFSSRRPMRLDSDGLPTYRIPLTMPPPEALPPWQLESRYRQP